MWVEIAQRLGLRTTDPAPIFDINATERQLGIALPETLRSLLLETDGLVDAYGDAVVFTARQTATRNIEMRSHPDFGELYMPFDHLLFIGEGGGGDLYGMRILTTGVDDLDVFKWDHENDNRYLIANSFEMYLEVAAADEE